MKESLIINFQLLKELSLSTSDILYLYNLYKNKEVFDIILLPSDLVNLQNRQFIKIVETDDKGNCKTVLREQSKILLKKVIVDYDSKYSKEKKVVKSKRLIENEIGERISDYRNLWKGKKAGSMGSAKSCKSKMIRWMEENPEYSFDDILKAARIYLDEEGRNTRYLQRADYFIFKQSGHKEEESRLSAYIEEIDNDPSEDWTSQIK